MAWVRIHDAAMTHPKIIGLSDKAFRLWVWGLSYAQQHLTDGLLEPEAMPARLRRAEADLLRKGLWLRADGELRIHHYLDWNDSREDVTRKRSEAKERMANARQRSSRELLRGVVKSGELLSERESEGKPAARSKRPIFTGQRLTVFEWMLDEAGRILGPLLDDFDIDQWFYDLDTRAAQQNIVIPQRDNGQWFFAQLVAEAQRRGLHIASSQPALGKTNTRLAAGLENIRREAK